MLPVIRTDPAASDLADIFEYLSSHSPAAAIRFAREFDGHCRVLAANPRLGRPRDDLDPGLKSAVVGKYVMFYRITPAALEVVRVLRGSQDARSAFGRTDS